MKTTAEAAEKIFHSSFEKLNKNEQKVVNYIIQHLHISRNINVEFDKELTFGQRLADRVAAFGGSWTFIIIFGSVMFGWIVLNSILLAKRGSSFDPYPYILLNLVLSMLAAIQAPIIMMSQNRQAAKDRIDAVHDYEVNLKAEVEINALHEKIDQLREIHLAEIRSLQEKQMELIDQLLNKKKTDG